MKKSLAIISVVMLALVVVGIVYYIMRSLALYRLLKQVGYHRPWMAWVPYLNIYAVGDVTADLCGENEKVALFGKTSIPAVLCRFWFFINIVLTMPSGEFGLFCNLITVAVTIFFTAGTFSVLMAKLRGTEPSRETGISLAASILPFVDVYYFADTRKKLKNIY